MRKSLLDVSGTISDKTSCQAQNLTERQVSGKMDMRISTVTPEWQKGVDGATRGRGSKPLPWMLILLDFLDFWIINIMIIQISPRLTIYRVLTCVFAFHERRLNA